MKNKISTLNFTGAFLVFVLSINLSFSCASCSKSDSNEDNINQEEQAPISLTKTVPIGPNSWIVGDVTRDQAMISEAGIYNWSSADDVVRTYVKLEAGELNVGLKMRSSDGTSKIKVSVGNISKDIVSTSTSFKVEEVGTFTVPSGYISIELKGLEKSGSEFVDISDILFGGDAITSGITFNPKSNYYFGRRGASVHMQYDEPTNKDVQWFYNEVTVPEGEDQLGSFFMANGHAQGYFGMQVNSENERRVLFSIWSAFDTDDPNQIPKDYKVTNLGNGAGVTVQDFGNEGSGIQSFIDVDWKSGVTYKFLLKGEPSSVTGSTDYTGYFFNPESGNWQLIASLRRPKTDTYLKRLHSFLENFNPSTGYLDRRVNYGNQWVYTTDNTWQEMTSATFTADATASNGDRLDFEGGSSGGIFFLKTCGFFNADIQQNTPFSRSISGVTPNIDFSMLETPQLPDAPEEVNLIDRASWSVIDYTSQEDKGGEGDTGRATDILDDNLDTYWHSCWNECTPSIPHYITIDMGEQTEVRGLRLAQRQSLSRAVKDTEIHISTDNVNWTSMGNYVLENKKEDQDINFSSSHTFRYLKITVTSSHDGTNNAAIAEIKAYKD